MANKSSGVEVRFSVKDFEAVVAALRATGDAGDAMARKLEQSGRAGSRGLNAIDTAAAGVRDRARALTGELGLVGNVLQSIGPWGLAAGAGIAATIIAFKQALEFADRFATKMQKVRDVANAAQISTDTLQALREAGQDVSVEETKVDAFAARFATGMLELRKGQGELFKIINEIDPALTRQLARARDMETAWNLVAQAYRNAGDAQRLELTKALAGQRNIGAGLILEQIANAGGVEKLASDLKKTGEIVDKELIQRLAKLKQENDSLKDSIDNTFGSLFSETTLRLQRESLEKFKEMADAARDFKASGDLKDFIRSLDAMAEHSWVYSSGKIILKSIRDQAGAVYDQVSGAWSKPDGRVINGKWVPNSQIPPDYTNDVPYGVRPQFTMPATVPNPTARPTQPPPPAQLDPEFELNRMRAEAAILGSAASPAEQRALKFRELEQAARQAGIPMQVVNRAMAEFDTLTRRAMVATRERLGIMTEEELLTSRLAELQKQRADGFIKTDEEMATAERNMRREVEETVRRMEIRNAEFPALKRLALDARDTRRTIDDLGTSMLNNFDNAFADAATSVDTLDSSLRKLALGGLRDIAAAFSRRFITGPIAEALGGGLKSITSLFGFAEGGIMTPNGPVNLPVRAYAKGGVARSPQISVWAEGKLPEAMVPLPDGRTIPVTLNGANTAPTVIQAGFNFYGSSGDDADRIAVAIEQRIGALAMAVKKQERAISRMPETIAAAGEYRPGVRR